MSRKGLLAVLGTVVLLGAIVVATGAELPWVGDASPDRGCDIPDHVTAGPPTAEGGIRVVDQGFSQNPSGLVSLGAVLENTSDQVAYRVPVRFRLFDAAEATVGPRAWLPRSAVGSLGPVTASYIRTNRFYAVSVDVRYRETSSNCRALDNRGTTVIFRDRTGRIIGGDHGPAGAPCTMQDTTGHDIVVEAQPPVTPSGDDTRTEVYPYCDLRPE
ncbi:MAG TPA: hypothetical protein VGL47_04115 [Amycolatopsis sp.]|uniref:hypothetical protein n=1 Tax=Amycolatopsis sp. TaxID=37632 RepID=UPI002F415971